MSEMLASDTMLLGGVFEFLGTAKYYVYLLMGFSLVVFFHELGHFSVAKWVGVRVEKFAIGFGPELFGFQWGETRYVFNILPLGGYVKMLGQEDFDADPTGGIGPEDPRSFQNKTVGQRMAVVSAGVIMNLVLAALLFMIVFMNGKTEVSPVVGFLKPGSPAEKAGLRVGDRVKSINDAPIGSFEQVRMAVVLADPLEPLSIVVERDGEELTKDIEPQVSDAELLQIGIGPAYTTEILGVGRDFYNYPPPHPEPGDIVTAIGDMPLAREDGWKVFNLLNQGRNDPVQFTVERASADAPDEIETHTIEAHKNVWLAPNGRDSELSPREILGLVPRVKISDVTKHSAADQAGLQSGDIITAWGGIAHPTPREIWEAAKAGIGRDMPVRVLREGKPLTERLIYRPMTLTPPPPALGLEFDMAETRAVVARVAPRSRAQRAGLKPGDVVTTWGTLDHPTRTALTAHLVANPDAGADIVIEGRTAPARLPMAARSPEAGLEFEASASGAPILRNVAARSRAGSARMRNGDVILRWGPLDHPTVDELNTYLLTHGQVDTPVWIEREDKALSFPIHYRSPVRPMLGFKFGAIEQDNLVIAAALAFDEILGRPTAAAASTLSKGCRLLTIGGEAVSGWGDVLEAFRIRAGSTAEIEYEVSSGGTVASTTMDIPRSLSTIAELPAMSPSTQAFTFLLDGRDAVLVDVNGKSVEYPAHNSAAIGYFLRERIGKDVTVTYEDPATGQTFEKTVAVTADMTDPWYSRAYYVVEIFPNVVTYSNRHTNPIAAIWAGVTQTYYSVAKAYLTFERMIFTRSVGVENVAGPLGILHIGGQLAQVSIWEMLYFLGLLSANLAVINFLPLPVVDGGLMVFLFIEKIKGSPVNIRIQIATQMFGLALIGTIFVLVTFNDIFKIFG